MWEFNYGEWTEAYVFLRLLGNGRIYAADENFMRNDNVYMDIIDVIRYEKNRILHFERCIKDASVHASENHTQFKLLAFSELTEKADFLYNTIKSITSSKRKFSVPEIENYLAAMRFSQPKAPKLPKLIEEQFGSKTDIIFSFEDSVDHSKSTTSFSVKSHLGSSPTLFNSAMSSNLIYEIIGCDDAIMNEINSNQIDSETGMFQYIKNDPKLSLKFIGTSDKFQANLDFIELTMAEILNCAMLVQIGYFEGVRSNSTKDIIEKVAEINPIRVKKPGTWYKAKMKDFLFASFSGLTATEPWDGKKLLSGGYIDVNKDGEILFYRAISDDIFSSYLFENTFFDRPSRGVNKNVAKVVASAHLNGREPTAEELNNVLFESENGIKKKRQKKGDWGYVYKENNKYLITLNFQIRFR